jgi:Rha family phage regulatory protein
MSQDIEPIVFEQDGKAWTTSLEVAERFGKLHKDVLRAIRDILKSDHEAERNFALSSYTTTGGKKLPSYDIDQDGFALLVFGFNNSPTAAAWKRRFLRAFKALVERLRQVEAIEHDRRFAALESKLEKQQRVIDAITADQERDDNYYTLDEIVRLLKIKDVPARARPVIVNWWKGWLGKTRRFPSKKRGRVIFEKEPAEDWIFAEKVRSKMREWIAKRESKLLGQGDLVDLAERRNTKNVGGLSNFSQGQD